MGWREAKNKTKSINRSITVNFTDLDRSFRNNILAEHVGVADKVT